MRSVFFKTLRYSMLAATLVLCGTAHTALAVPEIVPHKAIYTVRMAGVKNGSNVSDITGRMFFSWADNCHAWDVEQKTQLRFFYSEGEVSDSTTMLVSHESKDGRSYDFHVRHTADKEEPETAHGHAMLNADANGIGVGSAFYKGTQKKEIILSGNTTFPVHHTLQLLANARLGKKFFTMNVFDGADDKGMNEINAFIDTSVAASTMLEKASTPTAGSLNNNPLLAARGWPIRMAFFAPDSETGSPDYEMDMVLLDNGIIKTMIIDYDDFAIRADLTDIKPLPAGKCSDGDQDISPPS